MCKIDDCKMRDFSGGLCYFHFKIVQPSKNKEVKPINKVSDSLKVELAKYNKRVIVWKRENPKCKANVIPECTKKKPLPTTENHHMKGRIGALLHDEDNWLPCCEGCHRHLETHPAEAKEKNLSKSRLKKD